MKIAAYAICAVAIAGVVLADEARRIAELDLVLIPVAPGKFTMGSPTNEVGRGENEGPQTVVTLTERYWLGRTEVTCAQWRAIMGGDVVLQARRMLSDETRYTIAGKSRTIGEWLNLRKDTDPKELVDNTSDDAPMYLVSWDEAADFCRRLTERERDAHRLPVGYVYRLPTEAEWEYACRAGSKQATYAGDLDIQGRHNTPVLDAIAWYGGNSSVGYSGKGEDTGSMVEKQYPGGIAGQRAVATKKPNAWGFYDMIGNVDEWCLDWSSDKLPGGQVTDPRGPRDGQTRIQRGGTWHQAAQYCRAASRIADPPGWRARNLGFRIALAPELR